MQDVTLGCRLLGARDRRGDAVRQTVAAADHGKADAVADQALDLTCEVEPQQRHQPCDLGLGPPPVVAGERIERQRADALLGRRLHDPPDRLDAGFMAAEARQATPGRPSSIAVHDDADMKFGGEFSLEATLHCKAPVKK